MGLGKCNPSILNINYLVPLRRQINYRGRDDERSEKSLGDWESQRGRPTKRDRSNKYNYIEYRGFFTETIPSWELLISSIFRTLTPFLFVFLYGICIGFPRPSIRQIATQLATLPPYEYPAQYYNNRIRDL